MEPVTSTAPALMLTDVLADSRSERYRLFDRLNGPYLDWQLEQFRPYLGQRVLEIGCGVGGIMARLGPRELICGLDVDRDVLRQAVERFRDRPECRFESLDIATCSEAALAKLKALRFDTVVCINALEHIQNDLETLRRIERVLVPGGVLALLVPAHPNLYGPYDRLDGHFRRYSKAGLQRLVQSAGLQWLRCRYFNSIGAIGWWVQYRLLKRSIHGASAFRWMNRLIPVLRVVERWVPPPFGLSLVAVLQREQLRPQSVGVLGLGDELADTTDRDRGTE